MAKKRKTSRPKKEAFLAAYAEVGTITKACEIAGCSRSSHLRWLKDEPDYPERFKEAEQHACDRMTEEARRRAIDGLDKPVFQGGKKVGVIREYSDTLLIFLMKGAMPDKYKDRGQYEHSNHVDVKFQIVEDAGWFANTAHDDPDQNADGTPPPASGDSLASTNETNSVRPPVGENKDGHDELP